MDLIARNTRFRQSRTILSSLPAKIFQMKSIHTKVIDLLSSGIEFDISLLLIELI